MNRSPFRSGPCAQNPAPRSLLPGPPLLRQVAERSLFLWNNEYIVQLVAAHRGAVLPMVLGALEQNAANHWNPAVHRWVLGLGAGAAPAAGCWGVSCVWVPDRATCSGAALPTGQSEDAVVGEQFAKGYFFASSQISHRINRDPSLAPAPCCRSLTLNVRKMFQEMDAQLYEQCRQQYEEQQVGTWGGSRERGRAGRMLVGLQPGEKCCGLKEAL